MSDDVQVDGIRDHPRDTLRAKEMAMRIGFFITLIVFLIILFMYVTSMGTENETGMLFFLLITLVPLMGMGYLWRRANWKMRRAALEDGYD
jgi:L-asparagine transporter-like permease